MRTIKVNKFIFGEDEWKKFLGINGEVQSVIFKENSNVLIIDTIQDDGVKRGDEDEY